MSVDSILKAKWVTYLAGYSSLIASAIIFLNIYRHLMNYRKPFQQRLIIRIQLIVPLFAVSCFSMLKWPTKWYVVYCIEPTREIYEAFVIYTFFTLLTDMLKGERNIIITTSGREPVSHAGLLRYIFPAIDTSDPNEFLLMKRGILQYVWLKPFLCLGYFVLDILGVSDKEAFAGTTFSFWITILYNISVSLSLYFLAMFWKVLWNDLKPFKPMGKFLCVKLIIFASYWQGVILSILTHFNFIPEPDHVTGYNVASFIQNGLLCVELIAFAIGHWVSFSYRPFTISKLPYGRLKFYYAIRDMFGIKDLIYDFKLTFWGDHYKDYKRFDSVEALIAHPKSRGRMSRISQGLRYNVDQTSKHWIQQSQQGTRKSSFISMGNNTDNYKSNPPSSEASGGSIRGVYYYSNAELPPSNATHTQRDDAHEEGGSKTIFQDIEDINEKEHFEEDEILYELANKSINNYNLDSKAIRKMINYPIKNEIVYGHLFGFKVRQLRKNRIIQGSESEIDNIRHTTYGSTS